MKKTQAFATFVIGSWAALADAAPAQGRAGQLDPQFGNHGVARVLTAPGSVLQVAKVLVQPNGDILLLANAASTSPVVRLLPSGAPDNAFGTGGVVTITMPNGVPSVGDMALQPDGKLVVAGQRQRVKNGEITRTGALWRLLPNGAPDPNFGSRGVVTLPLPNHGNPDGSILSNVLLQPDGKYLLICYTSAIGDGVVRLNSDGTLDPTFGADGWVQKGFYAYYFPQALALQTDGKIVVGLGTSLFEQPAIQRLLPDGSFDTSLQHGTVISSTGLGAFERNDDYVDSVSVTVQDGGGEAFKLQRYNLANQLDRRFANPVIDYAAKPARGDESGAYGLLAQQDGKIVAGGFWGPHYFGNIVEFAMARVSNHGEPDNGFGKHGGVITRVGVHGQDGAYISAVAIQPDGKLIGAGVAHGPATTVLTAARYLGQ